LNGDTNEITESLLGESLEEEYGAGSELETTSFLILGLLTFWIYTVWTYSGILSKHMKMRLDYFTRQLEAIGITDDNRKIYQDIKRNGFLFDSTPKYVSSVLYSVCFLSLLILFVQKFFTGLLSYHLDITVVGVAAACFCISSVYFMWVICVRLRRHEYQETLLARLFASPDTFKIVPPSATFIKRWNAKQASIALFVILSIPMTLSPIFGVHHFYTLYETNSPYLDIAAFCWMLALLIIGGIFHVWGSGLLIKMYNDHLRIETLNREKFFSDSQWASNGQSSSVLSGIATPTTMPQDGSLVPERTLAAIMITDMVGFSKDMEVSEDLTYHKLLKHNEIIRKNIKKNQGLELKTMGDAFLVRFASAVSAVRSATNIQRDLSIYNESVDENSKIMIRIGIHIGDVLVMGQDVLGNGVNVAARIETLAEPGGILISADVYNLVKKSIDIKVLNLGRKELKNIKDTPELYKIVLQSVG
jgi:class 3 adenylate cyclase